MSNNAKVINLYADFSLFRGYAEELYFYNAKLIREG